MKELFFHILMYYAGVAELADAPDLGSGGNTVQVQVLSPAPKSTRFVRVLSILLIPYSLFTIP